MRRRALLSSIGALSVTAATGCGATPTDKGYVSGNGTLTQIEPDQRTAAPVLSGTTLDGTPYSSSELTGKVVVVNVWGSWCAPCRMEAADLQSASVELASVAAFLGINTRDPDPAQARAFNRTFAVTYPSLYDPAGELVLLLRGQVPPNGIPATLLIDKQGRIAARIIGLTTKLTLVSLVNDIANGR